MRTAIAQWWIGLSRRERLATVAATTLVVLALLYLAGIEPAWRTRERLRVALPQLRTQAAEVQALAAEAKKLGARARASQSSEQRQAALARLAAGKNLPAVPIREAGDQSLSLSLRRADAAAVLAWLKEASSEASLRIGSVRLARVGPGLVDVDVTFLPAASK